MFVLVLMVGAVMALGYWDQHRYDAKVPLGTWYGTFTSPTGSKGAMLVAVKRRPRGQDVQLAAHTVYFLGSVQVCFTAQARQYFRLQGYVDQSGPGFTFYLDPPLRAAAGWRFSDGLHGARRGNTLAMSGQLDSQPGVLATADHRQTKVTLAKGNDRRFADTCRALRARSQ